MGVTTRRVTRGWLAGAAFLFGGIVPRPANAQGSAVFIGALGGWVIMSVRAIGALTRDEPLTSSVGARVQAWAATSSVTIEGQLRAIDRDSITIAGDSTVLRIARADVRALRVDLGLQRRWPEGWVVGLVAGSATGILLGLSTKQDEYCDFPCFTPQENAMIGGVVLGIIGSSLGALIGSTIVTERWRTVDIGSRSASFGVVPILGRRNGLAVQLNF